MKVESLEQKTCKLINEWVIPPVPGRKKKVEDTSESVPPVYGRKSKVESLEQKSCKISMSW